jgi:glycosyltransferase involved in cell wall biosynthesis
MLCCYDLVGELRPHLCSADAAARFSHYLKTGIACADTIFCVSRQTKIDVETFFGSVPAASPKIRLVSLGADHLQIVADAQAKAYAGRRDYILYVSTLDRRKNHDTIYKAYVTLRQHYHMEPPLCIFVGRHGWGVDSLLTNVRADPRVKRDFLVLSHVSDAELAGLYQNCLFTVYPSLYEGWPLPLTESLSLGKFALAANGSSLPEAGGPFVEFLDPWNVDQWAQRIQTYVEDRELLRRREASVKGGYSTVPWRSTCEAVLEALSLHVA